MKAHHPIRNGSCCPDREPLPPAVFLFAGLKIAFRGICARPDRSSIGWRVLLAPAKIDSAIESR
jgi:hypothetical protein